MTGTEIIILIIGVVFVGASFFLGSKEGAHPGEPSEVDISQAILKIKEAVAGQEAELNRRAREIFEEKSSEILAETEERLNRISNDKMIAVDEFSRQVLEKIENNNQEVIFLYDMFQKKEEEMKSAINKLEQVRRENKELSDRPSAAGSATGTSGRADRGQDLPQDFAPPSPERPGGEEDSQPDGEGTSLPAGADTVPEEGQLREQVLALHRAKKSVKEISRQLSMGQGEVRLIIDLYGK